MSTRQIPANDWQTYFNRVGKALGTRAVQIEVDALDLGSQTEAKWIGLTNLSYDPHGQTIDIGTDTLDHRIKQPQEIWVQETADGLQAVEVVRPDGAKEIIRLDQALMLPAPAKS